MDTISQIRIKEELVALERKVPGALDRILNAADKEEIDGSDYTTCALYHAIQGSTYEHTAGHLSYDLCQELYPDEGRALLELELLIRDSHYATPEEDPEGIGLLVKCIQEVQADIEEQQIKNELKILEERFPGALQRINTAIDAGDIAGWTYGGCALYHTLDSASDQCIEYRVHAMTINDFQSAPCTLSDELTEELYGDCTDRLKLETLIGNVVRHTTAKDSPELATLQKLIAQVQQV